VSDVDDTGAVLQGLAAGGLRKSKAARRAVAFLKRAQTRDGGFPQMRGGSSNAQSTSWAVQGLVAAGRKPGAVKRKGHSPLSYLRSLQSKNGSIRYSRASAQTPVWVTAQALDALRQKAFPLAPAPRRAKSRAHSPAPPAKAAPKRAGRPGRAKKPHKPARKATPPSPGQSGSAPAPAGAAGPTGPAGPSGPADAQPGATDEPRESTRAMNRFVGGGGSGGAWAAGLLVGGVAALALWRLARRRQPR
jgi:hypothetical protein